MAMSDERTTHRIREAVGIFQSAEALQGAIDDLLSSGFDRAELSLLAGEHAVEQKLGHLYQRADALAESPAVPRTAYVSTEAVGAAEGGLIGGLMYVGATLGAGAVVASGGALAAAIAGAALLGGTGALVGAILARWVGHRHADHLQQQMEGGGLLLWVRTWNAEDEERAVEILQRRAGRDVHVHAFPEMEGDAGMFDHRPRPSNETS
jgi:hypothetical protein